MLYYTDKATRWAIRNLEKREGGASQPASQPAQDPPRSRSSTALVSSSFTQLSRASCRASPVEDPFSPKSDTSHIHIYVYIYVYILYIQYHIYGIKL